MEPITLPQNNPCLQKVLPRITSNVSNLTDDNAKRVSLIKRYVSISHRRAITDYFAEPGKYPLQILRSLPGLT
jgi:hypothetical protein